MDTLWTRFFQHIRYCLGIGANTDILRLVDAVLLRPLRPNQKVARCTERASDPAPLAESARREIQAVDPDLPVFGVRTLHGMLDASLAQRRFSAQLMAVFATLAMLLVAVRVYGVLAYSIRRRRARLASGWRMVLWQGMRLILAGMGSEWRARWDLPGCSRACFTASAPSAGVWRRGTGDGELLPAWRATRIDPHKRAAV